MRWTVRGSLRAATANPRRLELSAFGRRGSVLRRGCLGAGSPTDDDRWARCPSGAGCRKQVSPRVDSESSVAEFSSPGDHALCLFVGWYGLVLQGVGARGGTGQYRDREGAACAPSATTWGVAEGRSLTLAVLMIPPRPRVLRRRRMPPPSGCSALDGFIPCASALNVPVAGPYNPAAADGGAGGLPPG